MANTKIGVLWLKKNDNVGQYFSGMLNDLKDDIRIVIFKNKNKGEKGPDYIIYRSEERKERTERAEEEIIIDDESVIPEEESVNVDNIPFS
jgi:uncharacterized protein (DUF736 family)